MPETRPSSKSISVRVKALEAKLNSLHAWLTELAELSDNLSQPEDERLFALKSATVEEDHAEYSRVSDELIAVKLELDPNYSPSYEAFRSFKNLMCRVRFAKAAIAKKSDTKPVKEERRSVRTRLPPIELLKFSGDAIKWPIFAEIFKRAVGNSSELSDAEKAHYLISHIQGPALSAVSGVLPTGENYPLMWDLLTAKYEDTRVIANTYLTQLLNFRPLTSHDAKNLTKFCDEFETAAAALRALSLPDLADFILTHLALNKLDTVTVQNFERSLGTEMPSFSTLSSHIHEHCKVLTRTDAMHGRAVTVNVKSLKTHVLTAHSDKPKSCCAFCTAVGHAIYLCEKFKKLSPSDRLKATRTQKLCVNCLGRHSVSQCNSNRSCNKCGKNHHSLLHLDKTIATTPNERTPTAPSPSCAFVYPANERRAGASREMADRDGATPPGGGRTTVCPTAVVNIVSPERNKRVVKSIRVLLDSGSGANFITKSVCIKHRLLIHYAPSKVFGIGNSSQNVIGYTHLAVSSRFDARCTYKIRASVVNKLTVPLPLTNLTEAVRESVADLPLADGRFDVNAEINCILGAAIFPKVLGSRKIKLPRSDLYAVDSTLGYLIMGETAAAFKQARDVCFLASEADAELNRHVQAFWELETVADVKHLSPDEKACEADFTKNVSRLEDGTFMVALPFKEDPSVLGDSRYAAERRLISLEKRLDTNPELRAGYNATFSEYLSRGFLQEVIESAEPPLAYYIPHRAVYNPDKITSRIRLVLDASCKSSSGKSLNDVLHCGPNLQSHIFHLLINFRLFKVALSADIEKMYFSIKVQPRHRCFLRVLYRFSPNEPVGAYEFSSLPMGLSSASYLSVRVLRQLFREEDGPGLRRLLETSTCTYMDDYLLSVQSLEEATSIRLRLTESHARAGFKLTKWLSNSKEFMKNLEESSTNDKLVELDSDNQIKLVGLWWDPNRDSFLFKAREADSSPTCTKRHMLAVTASLYDPLGFLTPMVAGFKLLIQECWKRELGWDQAVPEDIAKGWRELQADMPAIARLAIPRHIGLAAEKELTLLGFADASERCMGAVVYARIGPLDEDASALTLLCAKSRLAPLKRVTLARLELCAAHLLALLVRSVTGEIEAQHPSYKVVAFSDSTVTLAWIRASPHRWQTFVANRVSAIQEIIPSEGWFHVAGVNNPSDIITRPPLPGKLVGTEQWVNGPTWARLPSSQWPCGARAEPASSEDIPEAKEISLSAVTVPEAHILDELVGRMSDYDRLMNVVVHILRFCKKLASRGPISPADQAAAEITLLRRVQAVHFADEIRALERGELCGKSVRKLSPCLIGGILCVGGRLKHSELSLRQKHPILLPVGSRVAELIVRELHVKNFHTGPGLLLAITRSKYWILSARRLVRRVVHSCNVCFKSRPVPSQPFMGNLPKLRLKEGKSFFNAGVDYAGPITVRVSGGRGARTTKAYICVFVCLATKALHIELVSDLSTNLFIAAFKRFISRRGPVSCILSDGGRNFIGAKRKLGEIHSLLSSSEYDREVIRELTPLKTEFKINPPLAPHFGGLWEANVKCIKTHLFRVIGTQVLTYEELNTLLVQIETVLNSRPLCVLSNDPNEPVALTPAHFLSIQPLSYLPAQDLREIPLARLPRHALVDQMVQSYWDRWRREYLSSLQSREKWNVPDKPLRVGQVVVLNEPNVPTLCWPLGLITEIFPGSDGVTRVVRVKTKGGSYVRPATRVCVLPTQ